MMRQIMVVGSLNMDLVVQLTAWPAPGETVMGRSYRALPGGKGANQAIAAARQGATVQMVGCVGQDEFGQSLLQSLRVAGVGVAGVRTASSATGVALVAVEAGGESRIVVVSGANRAVTVQHVEDMRREMAEADWLLLQLEIPLEATLAAAQLAHHLGTKVLLNPAPAPSRGLSDELLAYVDVLVPSEGEALHLTGAATAHEAAVALRARGVETVIVTLGARGALLADTLGVREIAPFSVEVVDTTAAGDAFVGTLAAALSAGKEIGEAAQQASAAGALAVTKLGAQPSLPALEAVEALIAAAENRAPAGYPEELIDSFTSAEGEEVLVRPILPSDAARLQALFLKLSPESIYRRFFTQRRPPTDNEAMALASVDYHHSLALVAVLPDEPDELIGVARFAPTEDRPEAVEMAIVVADAFHHHGIGRHLFQALATAAQGLGHRWMLAETQSDNSAMIELAERSGYPTEHESEGTLLRLWLALQEGRSEGVGHD